MSLVRNAYGFCGILLLSRLTGRRSLIPAAIEGNEEMAAPAGNHQLVVAAVVAAWLRFDAAQATGILLPGPMDLEINERLIVQPDVVWLPREADLTSDPQFVRAVPLVIAEVLSPSTASTDLTGKYQAYRKAGVLEYWMIDPESCELFLHRLKRHRYHRQNPDDDGFCESATFNRRVRVVRHGPVFMVEDRPIA